MVSRRAESVDLAISGGLLHDVLQLLLVIVTRHTEWITSYDLYYSTLAELALADSVFKQDRLRQTITELVCAPLSLHSGHSKVVYRSFGADFLISPNLQDRIDLRLVASVIDLERLQAALLDFLHPDTGALLLEKLSKNQRLWLLVYFIFIFRTKSVMQSSGSSGLAAGSATNFMRIVNILLSNAKFEFNTDHDMISDAGHPRQLDYVLDQTNLLVDRTFMTQLFRASAHLVPSNVHGLKFLESAAILANYLLILFKTFPNRKNDVRTWMYATTLTRIENGQRVPIPAVHYFWLAFSFTGTYHRILESPTAAVEMIRVDRNLQEQPERYNVAQAWRVGLLFLELYSFALRVMDDEEFVHGFDSIRRGQSMYAQGALPLSQVKDLSVFLKNLAFAIYWHSPKLLPRSEFERKEIYESKLFGKLYEENGPSIDTEKEEWANIPGVPWANLPYVKGLVTGVLRALYERE